MFYIVPVIFDTNVSQVRHKVVTDSGCLPIEKVVPPCAGPAIFARALNLPKYVDVIAVIVFLSDFAMRTPENTMPAKKALRIPLPKAWTRQVRSATLHLISLA